MELRDIRVFILAGAGKEVMTLGFLCNSAYAEILQGGYKVKTEITCAIEPARELLKPRTSKANKEYDAVFLSGNGDLRGSAELIKQIQEDYPEAVIIFASDDEVTNDDAIEKGAKLAVLMEPLFIASNLVNDTSIMLS